MTTNTNPKKAMVTGATGGIGLEIAKLLASYGYQVTGVARRLDTMQEQIAKFSGTGHADLSNNEDIKKIATHLNENKYDLLVNNAGRGLYGKFADIPIDDQLNMISLNIDSMLSLSHAFLSTAKTGDCLVNIASFLGLASYSWAAAYAGTKGFVIRFSESLWYEQKKKGIFVTAFCPGLTKTPFHSSSGGSDDKFPDFMQQSPEQVAREALQAIRRRRHPRVISGLLNRLNGLWDRLLPRRIMVSLMGFASPLK